MTATGPLAAAREVVTKLFVVGDDALRVVNGKEHARILPPIGEAVAGDLMAPKAGSMTCPARRIEVGDSTATAVFGRCPSGRVHETAEIRGLSACLGSLLTNVWDIPSPEQRWRKPRLLLTPRWSPGTWPSCADAGWLRIALPAIRRCPGWVRYHEHRIVEGSGCIRAPPQLAKRRFYRACGDGGAPISMIPITPRVWFYAG